MRQTVLIAAIVATLLGATLSATLAQPAAGDCTQTPFISLTYHFFLPVVAAPTISQPPPGTNVLANGSFEAGWTDINGSIQQANYWAISWIPPGQPVYDGSEIAWAEPEFTHKCNWQLPPHEQLGQPEALILDGITTYKVFHAGASFAGELRQTVSGLPPGRTLRLTAPIWLDPRDDTDPWGSASGVWLNGAGDWVWAGQRGRRAWYEHKVSTTIPGNGQVELLIRLKSKWRGVDFFIDDLKLDVIGP